MSEIKRLIVSPAIHFNQNTFDVRSIKYVSGRHFAKIDQRAAAVAPLLVDFQLLVAKHSTNSTQRDKGVSSHTISVDSVEAHKNHNTIDLRQLLSVINAPNICY